MPFERLLRLTQLPADANVSRDRFLHLMWVTLSISAILQVTEAITDHLITASASGLPDLGVADFFWVFRIHLAYLISYVVLLGLGLGFKTFRGTYLLCAFVAAVDLSNDVPSGANHNYLNAIALSIASLGLAVPKADDDSGQASADSICFLRWLVVYVMLWSGINKLLYGVYFQGEFFARAAIRQDRFNWFFGLIMPADELKILAPDYRGPNRFQSPLPILASNLVYITEIVTGILLMIPRTAIYGAAMTLMVLIGIEVVAKELVFGALMVNMLMLYIPSFFVRWGYWIVLGLYAIVATCLLLNSQGINTGIT